MSSSYSYAFDSLTRLGDDTCYISETQKQNTSFGAYSITNHFANNCGLVEPMKFALNQPNVFVNGGFGHTGAGGCNVDSDSMMKIGKVQNRPKGRISLYTRPFVTVPYLGRGALDAVKESQLQQGQAVTELKSCSTVSENSFLEYHNYPLIDEIKETISNPVNLVEGAASEGWIQGGIPTRDLIRDTDYMQRQ